jgi:O-antigen ligase
MLKKYQIQFDTLSKVCLIGVFFSFPTFMGLANTLTALVLYFWLLSGDFSQRWKVIKDNPITKPVLLLYTLILFGITYSSGSLSDIILHVGKYSKLLIALVFLSLLHEDIWRKRSWYAFSLGMLYILVLTYASIWINVPWSATHELGWGVNHTLVGDYITQNVMMSFFVVLSLTNAQFSVVLWKKWAWYITSILASLCVTHLSQGRTGYLVLSAALIAFFFSLVKPKYRIMTVLGISAILIMGLLTSHTMTQRFEQAWQEAKNHNTNIHTSIGHRLFNYKVTIELIKERPITGWGTGSYSQEMCKVVRDPNLCKEFGWHPHNQFLLFGQAHGLLGIVAYLFLIYRVFSQKGTSNPSGRLLIPCFTAIWMIDSLFNSPLFSSRENHFFMFVMALLMANLNSTPKLPAAALMAKP